MVRVLNTERLRLRKITLADSASLFTIWSDPDVTKFMNIECFSSEEQARDMIAYINKLSDKQKANRYAIIELKTNEIIGSCGFNTLNFENKTAEIGYELAKNRWGYGYATEAASALLDYAFHSLYLDRVDAKVDAENSRSIKMLKKLNFVRVETLKQREEDDGTVVDIHIYSKLNKK